MKERVEPVSVLCIRNPGAEVLAIGAEVFSDEANDGLHVDGGVFMANTEALGIGGEPNVAGKFVVVGNDFAPEVRDVLTNTGDEGVIGEISNTGAGDMSLGGFAGNLDEDLVGEAFFVEDLVTVAVGAVVEVIIEAGFIEVRLRLSRRVWISCVPLVEVGPLGRSLGKTAVLVEKPE